MASTSPLCLVTPRDRDLLAALERCPLTVRQLLALSKTFAYPFTTERRVQERLQRLAAAGRVRQWRYATAGQGALSYFTLSPLGFRLLHPEREAPTSRGLFSPVGVARQAHAHALADVLVKLFIAAHADGVAVAHFHRENSLRLTLDGDSLYPDAAFELRPPSGGCFRFFLELDNASETIAGTSNIDSISRKVAFYERYQDIHADRLRVLTITTAGPQRVANLLATAQAAARNPQRSLIYAAALREFLATKTPLNTACFRNHRAEAVALLPQSIQPLEEFLAGACRPSIVQPLMPVTSPC